MGEWTDVASANRGVRGGFSEESEEEELEEPERAGVRFRAAGRRFSSRIAMARLNWGCVF